MTNQQRRTIKIWQVLIAYAARGKTITYGRLADLIDDNVGANLLRPYLDRVEKFCLEQPRLPNLAVIAVSRDTGVPGRDIALPHGDVNRETQAVYDEPWFGITSPTPDDIRR